MRHPQRNFRPPRRWTCEVSLISAPCSLLVRAATDDAVVAHYAAIAAAADLPFFCYNLPQSTNLEITAELMEKIKAGVPQLRGVKHSAPAFGVTAQFVEMGLDVFAGDSSLMLQNLTLGGKGCIDGPPLMAPEIWVEIYNAWKAGDVPRAQAAQKKAADIKFWVRKVRDALPQPQ